MNYFFWIFIIGLMFIKNMLSKIYLYLYRFKFKRYPIVLYHDKPGFFSTPMITEATHNILRSILFKAKDKPVDLILHTPGGTVFHSVLIAKLIQKPNIRVIVPKVATSGGTLIALSSTELVMSDDAVLSMIDPQVGSFFTGAFNKQVWKEICKVKKDKVKDENIGYKILSKQVTKSLQKDLKGLLAHRFKTKKELNEAVKFLTESDKEHSYQLDKKELRTFIKVSDLDHEQDKFIDRMLAFGYRDEVSSVFL